jgi:hypothetical protein
MLAPTIVRRGLVCQKRNKERRGSHDRMLPYNSQKHYIWQYPLGGVSYFGISACIYLMLILTIVAPLFKLIQDDLPPHALECQLMHQIFSSHVKEKI